MEKLEQISQTYENTNLTNREEICFRSPVPAKYKSKMKNLKIELSKIQGHIEIVCSSLLRFFKTK